MYVENDFLMALVKQEDWLQEPAHRALEEYDDIHTSIAAYTEFLILAYDQDTGEYQIDVGRALADLSNRYPFGRRYTNRPYSRRPSSPTTTDLRRSTRYTAELLSQLASPFSPPNGITTISASTAFRSRGTANPNRSEKSSCRRLIT